MNQLFLNRISYRTGSGSNRILDSTQFGQGFELLPIHSSLSEGSGRYRSRFCNHRARTFLKSAIYQRRLRSTFAA